MKAMYSFVRLAVGFVFSFIVLLASHSQAASLIWSPSSGMVDGYRIYYSTTPGDLSTFVDLGGATRFDLDRLPLTENTTYHLCVSAYNAAGESPPCAPVYFTPGDTTPPAPPVGLTTQ